MQIITFITGNQHKADYLAQYIGLSIEHIKLDLDEIQSLDLKEIVTHKVKQAYNIIGKPVLVEDVSLEFEELGGLPGPFIKFFVEHTPEQMICNMVSDNRNTTARCVFGYYDGENLELFEGSLSGQIAHIPGGDGGYGWDRIFIPKGYDTTRAGLSAEDDQKTYLQIKPLKQVKQFLLSKKL